MIRRLGYIFGPLVALALAGAWVNSYGLPVAVQLRTPGRWFGIVPHRGRIVLSTTPQRPPTARWRLWAERYDVETLDFAVGSDRAFTFKERSPGKHMDNFGAPIWSLMLTAGALMAWRWRVGGRRRCVVGFPMETEMPTGGGAW